jgi:hypothetical protein
MISCCDSNWKLGWELGDLALVGSSEALDQGITDPPEQLPQLFQTASSSP